MPAADDDSARDDDPMPPAGGTEPPRKLRAEEKQWGALAHVAVVLGLVVPVLGGPLGPLAVRLTKGKQSAFVDANAVEALNFGILLAAAQLVVSVVSGAVVGPGGLGVLDALGTVVALLPLVVTLAVLVLPGMPALKANSGRLGRYPEAMPRFVKEDDDEGAE